MSAGVALAIEQASQDGLDTGARWALCGGAAVYLACLTVAQRALTRGVSRRKVIARVLAIAALAAARPPPARRCRRGSSSRVTAAVLLALVAFEMWAYHQVQRTGSA